MESKANLPIPKSIAEIIKEIEKDDKLRLQFEQSLFAIRGWYEMTEQYINEKELYNEVYQHIKEEYGLR